MSSTATSSRQAPPVIALTPGEPAGVGPDITIMLAQQCQPAALVCYADPALLSQRATLLGLPLKLHEIDATDEVITQPPGTLQVSPVRLAVPVVPGQLDPENAQYVLHCLDLALADIRLGKAQALVTGPVQKSVVNDAGIPFSGHTEYLAAKTGTALPVMMLASDSLRVALATTHVALNEVAARISIAGLTRTLTILHDALKQRFAVASPRIAVCGLNPHAGENGHLGREEIDIIRPAVDMFRTAGHDVTGPLPADTVFAPDQRNRFDAILAMYHDQGLAPLKALEFGGIVNITLGMPIVRTSVDHGTALDLAGSGQALAGSLQSALDAAVELSSRSEAHARA